MYIPHVTALSNFLRLNMNVLVTESSYSSMNWISQTISNYYIHIRMLTNTGHLNALTFRIEE